MKEIKVIIEWASDGGVSAYMRDEAFAGQGDTVNEAVEDMKKGVAFYIATAKEMGFPYKDYLDGEYGIELEYDIQSMLDYASHYMTITGLEKLTGINKVQIRRYAHGEAKPRPAQKQKILEAIQKFAASFAISL